MARSGMRTAAEFVREQGWGVGTVLRGEPIFHNGEQIERARLVRITGIGEETVLGRTQIIGETRWGYETSRYFNARDWSLAVPESTTHPKGTQQ